MSNEYVTQLADTVYGSASTTPTDPKRVKVSVTEGDTVLIHAWIGGVYLATTERNWQTIFNAITQVEVPVTRTHVIRMDDATGTATITTVTA